MPNHLRPRTTMSLGGLSLRQVAVGMWKRLEEHDAMTCGEELTCFLRFARHNARERRGYGPVLVSVKI